MAVERPTFHESWYRVADLHPRLRSTVQISRQHFRGLPWHVVQDHTNNAFFRLAEPAYRFIGLLDGKRTVGESWRVVTDQLGDEAPTQGEVIQLLGQLYVANLLQAEVPADTHTLFARYKKRKQREIASYFMNIMFARLPLFDPDAFLNRWLPVLGWIFSPLGLVVWLVLLALGINSIVQVPQWQQKLGDAAAGLLSPDNLILLYIGFAMIKACHEMGHAISCKKFGRQSGTGGEVHVIGIMFLVFTPVPYVDASSSWALTNKWHRAIVGAAGMWVELAIASIAAWVWAGTADAHWLHAFAYNIMFVASFSTVVFNANPLLRYDGYYILSDLLEIPNLGQRAKDFLYHLVKRYAWNVRFSRSPAHSAGERIWLFLYAIASFLMRTFVSISIMFYLTTVLEGTLIILATAMAIAGLFTWLVLPLGKFVHYLATSTELSRVRARAVASTALVVGAIVVGVGVINVPQRKLAQGIVEPEKYQELFAGENGFVDTLAEVEKMPVVQPDTVLVKATNPTLAAQRRALEAERNSLKVEQAIAMTKNPADVLLLQAHIEGATKQIAGLDERLGRLELRSQIAGTLIAPTLEARRYGYLPLGDHIGVVADLDHLIVRAAVSNDIGGQLAKELESENPADRERSRRVEMRIDGQPEIFLSGRMEMPKSGQTQLPSPALGFQVGGQINTVLDDRQGTRTVEQFFEARIVDLQLVAGPKTWMDEFKATGRLPLLPGQRVLVRFELSPQPLAVQAWTKLRQMFQSKFQL